MDEMRIIHDIAYAVRKYVPGELGWIAKQDDKERDDVWAFVIGKGVAALTMEQALNADDKLYRELATQIMGFAPDSPQDYHRRQVGATQRIREIDATIEQLQKQRQHWQAVIQSLPIINLD